MHETLIEPARRWADLTIRDGVGDTIALELAVDRTPDPGP